MEAESYNWVNNGEWGNEVFYPICKKINKSVHMKISKKLGIHQLEKDKIDIDSISHLINY